jgi:hypothetical protein
MQEERDDDLDNVGACIERLNSIGFAVEVYKTDSFDLGVPEKGLGCSSSASMLIDIELLASFHSSTTVWPRSRLRRGW